MMKRALSLLLCMVMILGVTAPSVRASGIDSSYISDDIMDHIVVEDGSNVDIVVDGNTVSTSENTKLPNPADLVTKPLELPYSFGAPVAEEPVAEPGCQCADFASAVKHSGVCLVKAPYMALCEGSAEELFAQWDRYDAREQAFLLEHLYNAFPLKYVELEKLLKAPTGCASDTYVDGTTVSVQGIPQDGSLTVGEAADEVKNIVDTYVSEQEQMLSPLFGYDVSVQDGEGADWQPDTSVKMELELPGEKLHKNTKVFVVHVDDDGVATTIEATVTEDGKIAFETPGFSAFYGFTVDFHYEDITFSIPGMSSIKLSELFDELKVPLNASDVVALDYTDDTQIKIEQLEGDWELTSLKAFSTEEKLTMTMADGSVYEIKVTDAEVLAGTHNWHIYNGYYGSYNHIYSVTRFPYDGGNSTGYGYSYNAIFNDTFYYAYNHAAGSYYYWDDYDDSGPNILRFDNANQNTTINLVSKTAKETVVMDMVTEFYIRNGANVTFQVGSDSNSATKTIIIRSADPAKPLFSIVNGSLTIKGSANTRIVLEFGANSNGTPGNLNQEGKFPLIWENGSGSTSKTSARSLYLENVTFRHSAYSAIDLYYSQMTNVTLKNCSFESTVDNVSHGGAVRVRSEVNLPMTKFEAEGCTFNGNQAAARGGAIALQRGVQSFIIKDCQFSNCAASTHGGAISLTGDVGNISITGTKTADGQGGYSYTTSFVNCSSVNRGGAVGANCSSFGDITVENVLISGNTAGSLGGGLHFGNTDAKASITAGAVSVTNCDFKDNMAHGLGGGLCVTDGEYESISVTNCTFDRCDTSGYGGAIGCKIASGGSAIKFSVREDVQIIGCSFTNCLGGNLAPNGYTDILQTGVETWDHDNDPSTPVIDKLNGASGAGAIIVGGDIGGKLVIKGADQDHPTLFENCLTWNNGGAIFFTDDLNVKGVTENNKFEAVTLQYLDMDKCFARDAGSAIYFSSAVIPLLDMNHCTIQNCGYFDAADPNFPEDLIEITNEWFTSQTVYKITGYDEKGDPVLEKDEDKTAAVKAQQLARWTAYPREYLYLGTDYSGTFRTVGNTACVAKIADCELKNNRSSGNGGAVYWNANSVVYEDPETKTTPILIPSLTITNTPIHDNYASGFGGGIFCEGTVTIESCEIYNNTAGARGGGIAQNVYNNTSRQLGESGANETTTLVLRATDGGEPVKIYGNTAEDGGGISITVGLTNSYPHTIKPGVTDAAEKDKPENWIFKTDFTYDVTFRLGGTHVYENKASRNGGGIFYNTTYYLDQTGVPEDGVSWVERQRQVDSFVKDIKIDDGLIYGNIAGYGSTEASGGGGNGGGVFMSSSQVNTVDNIPADQKTGSSAVTITGGSIYKNRANIGNGGGVYLTGENARCTITGDTTTIGAEYLGVTADGKANLSTDGANKATNRHDGKNLYTGGCGGGIAIFGGARIEMDGGYVVNNKAYTAGGGVAVHGVNSTMYMHNGYIDGNESSNGGGISLNGAAGDENAEDEKYRYGMYFDGGVIRNNIASYNQDKVAYGGGICLSAGGSMKLDGGNVSENKAVTDSSGNSNLYQRGQEGGGIAVCQGSELLIKDGTISNNRAYDGGGMTIRGASTVTLNGSLTVGTDADGNEDMVLSSQGSITNNYAYKNGGGVYMADMDTGVNTFNMTNGYIANNEADSSGTVWSKGGGIYLGLHGAINLNGGRIENNAAYDGGAILGWRAVMNIENGEIKGNTSKRNGGGIYADYSSLRFTGGKIYNNTTVWQGGGIFCWSNQDGEPQYSAATLVISGGDIFGNQAGQEGGGVYFDGGSNLPVRGTATVSGGAIYDNQTGAHGGGLFIQHATFNMQQGSIRNNDADGQGGGAYLKDTVSSVSNGTFTNNAGRYGGGIFMDMCTSVSFTGGIFHKNYSNQGAGLFVRSCTVDIQNITITENEAKTDERYPTSSVRCGGGVLIDSANGPTTVTINGGIFNQNKAPNGAGMWITNNGGRVERFITVTINGGEFRKNETTGNGGGILLDGGNLAAQDQYTCLTMNGGLIAENIAKGNGGGLYVQGQAKTIIETGVQKDSNGNTLKDENGKDKLTYGEITENQAKNGGGIYVTTGADLTVTNGYITYNQAIQPSDVSALLTAKGNDTKLYGTGGGICVTNDEDAKVTSRFTLNSAEGNNDMAIYGNVATFSADDVFSSGNNTKLEIPVVADMDLAGFDNFKPEGWFEDYNTGDTAYGEGLNMTAYYGYARNVQRYRNAIGLWRMHIVPDYVTGTNIGNAEYVTKDNAYVAMTLGLPAAVDDTVVVDYSGPVNIDLYQNDLFILTTDFAAGCNYLGLSLPQPDNTTVFEKNYVYFSTGEHPIGTYDSDGHVRSSTFNAFTGNSGVITFSPVRNSLKMDTEARFTYTVKHNGYWYYAKVVVVPATSIYFEDHSTYVTYHSTKTSGYNKDDNVLVDNLAPWKRVDSAGKVYSGDVNDPLQDQDRPGSYFLQNLDADNVYGHDNTYLNYTTFSNYHAHKVTVKREFETVNGQQVEKLTNARATFSFTGTGFDIISMCNQNSGLVMVSIYEEDSYQDITFNHSDWTKTTTPIKSYMVDTWYQIPGQTLYQVPVIKVSGLDYGTYTVEIYVAPSFHPSEHAYQSADFYLDAIRIYDPAGVGGSQSQAAQDAYIADGECWPVYQELRMLFLKQTDLKENASISGMLFIDGSDGPNAAPTVKEYKSYGPNNEVYLNPNQSIAFTMNATAYTGSVDRVHLGLRGLSGYGDVHIRYQDAKDSVAATTILDTLTEGSRKLSTADMYYDVSAAIGKVLVVTNNGTTPIAISNLKVTHTEEPAQQANVVQIVSSDFETLYTALEILTPEQLVDPVVTPKRPALSFNGMVCYNVFFTAEELGALTAEDLGLAVFSTEDTEGTVETAREVIYGATKIGEEYMVATNGVHAKYLGDKQYFRAFAKKADGTYVYSKMVSYSALDYAKNALAKSDDVKLKQLVVAMLNYGAEAQKFFGYKTDDLMNATLTADDQALLAGFDATSLNAVGKVDASKVGAFASTGGFSKRSPAISFKGAFEINYFMTPANAVDGDMTLYFWNEDTYNAVGELTAQNADKAVTMTLENGTYSASSDEIAARYLDQTVYVAAVYESNGVRYCSGVLPYSIAAYCQKPPAGVQALATAAAIYGCTAKAYFGG